MRVRYIWVRAERHPILVQLLDQPGLIIQSTYLAHAPLQIRAACGHLFKIVAEICLEIRETWESKAQSFIFTLMIRAGDLYSGSDSRFAT